MIFKTITPVMAAVLLLSTVGGGVACSPLASMPAVEINTEEQMLASIDTTTWIPESFRISPDNRTFVFGNKVDGKEVVVVNGEEQKRYDEVFIYYMVFSPDSKHMAYAARSGEEYFMVIDGREYGPYDEVFYSKLLEYSSDSKRLAYAIRRGEKMYVIVGDEENGPYDNVSYGINSQFMYDSIFSKDGSVYVFGAMNGPKWFAVINGEAGPEYDTMQAPVMSKTGKRIAYIAGSDNHTFMVIDGKEGNAYDSLSRAVFSPDESRVAYIAQTGEGHTVVLDGQEGKTYSDIGQILVFSPDSKNIVYDARSGDSIYMVVNEKENGPYSQADPPVFSHDGSRIAYAAKELNGWIVNIDGENSDYFIDIARESIVLSPDGQRVAFVAQEESGEEIKESGEELSEAETAYDRYIVVVDGKKGKEYRGIGQMSLVFSPDSTHFAYAAYTPDYKAYIVLDGAEIGPYDDLVDLAPVFVDGGSVLVYAVHVENEMYIVANGTAAKKYDGILNLNGGDIVVDSPGTFHYLSVANNKVYLVEETLTYKQ